MAHPLLTLSDLPSPPAECLRRNLERLREAIARACGRSGRSSDEIEVVAVTKYAGTDLMRLLHELGVRHFGESRVQEGIAKARAVADLPGVHYHLVGHLQRNKVARALECFRTVHSLDSLRLLREIEARIAASGRPPPDLYVEVNVSGEAPKTGLEPDRLPELLEALKASPHFGWSAGGRCPVRGLMGMATLEARAEAARPYFRRLRELRDHHAARGLLPPGAGLSMGMSGDFEVAVEEGATAVRVGSALFAAP